MTLVVPSQMLPMVGWFAKIWDKMKLTVKTFSFGPGAPEEAV